MRLYIFLLSIVIGMYACIPSDMTDDDKGEETQVAYNFADSTVRKISDLQNQQNLDKLFPNLQNPKATVRYACALAMASIKKEETLDSLVPLLHDPSLEVAAMAAYAIGQLGNELATPSLINSFRQFDTISPDNILNHAILEAVGKSGDQSYLRSMSTVNTYQTTDTMLLLGQTLGVYRFMLRGMIDSLGTNLMINYVLDRNIPTEVRVVASNYLYRAKGIHLGDKVQDLIGLLQNENNPEIRMCLVIALGKSKALLARDSLLSYFDRETDYRVKCNLLRALANWPLNDVAGVIEKGIKDANIHVSTTAAKWLVDYATSADRILLTRLSLENTNGLTKILLVEAFLKHVPYGYNIARNNRITQLKRLFGVESNPIVKGRILKTLANDVRQINFIAQEALNSTLQSVRTQGFEALKAILENPKFSTVYGGNTNRTRRQIWNIFKQGLESKDPSICSVIAGAIQSDPNLVPADDIALLKNTQSGLSADQTLDAYNDIGKAVAAISGEDAILKPIPSYLPIRWDILAQYPGAKALIKTSRGDIQIEFMPTAAPATVSNIISLINDGFYTNKVFHRVVPNFVIQTGCSRGDGYGTLNKFLRSELPPLHYDQQGYVGMASSGNHTESTQFFITHSPTLHLDGNYTIFAKVISGMDVVHRIELGDLIENISIL